MGIFKTRRRHGWSGLGGRAVQTLLSLIGASLLIWAIMPLAPGDPARRVLQSRGVVEPTEIEIEDMRRELNLDQPYVVRYVTWAGGVLKGDFGLSWQTGQPVRLEFLKRLPATVMLAVTAFILAMIVAIPAGLLAARWKDRWPDHVLRILALVGSASPSFIIALLFIHFLVIGLGWGRVVLDGHFDQVWMPAGVLAVDIVSIWSRLLRASLLETINQPFALSAKARGASANRVLLVHAFPNASIPLFHAMGISIGSLLGGAIIVETIFTWPGLGRYVIEAITARDLPVVQAYALFSTVCYVSISLLVDIVSAALDPRIVRRFN